MSKINIIKNKITKKQIGNFNHRPSHYIMIRLSFQNHPEIEKEILKFLSKNFDIKTKSQTSNKKGRGSITRSRVPDSSYTRGENNG